MKALKCSRCGKYTPENLEGCLGCGQPLGSPERAPEDVPIRFEGSKVKISVKDVPGARYAVKKLKLKRRELLNEKRGIIAAQKESRFRYTHKTRVRGLMFRGGGGIGSLIRAVQAGSRQADRRRLAAELAPLEEENRRIETQIHQVDALILQLESYMLDSTES